MLKYTTKTEYGLICLVYMAKQGHLHPITIREISGAEQYSQTYIEKILQSLRGAQIVKAQSGTHGGYVLARPADQISLKEIIEALEGQTFQVFCEPNMREQIVCTHFGGCHVKPVWRMARELLDRFFASVTLEQIVQDQLTPAQITP